MLSIADCCPTSGLAPAPSPSVKFTPNCILGTNYFNAESVLQTIKSTPLIPFKHVVYSVTTASTYTNTLITFDWFW
jgi:hypothetical protein